jgi:CRISPR-associated protein Csm1
VAKTISRFATLSRSMNNFFLWCINYIAEEHNIYITYSGGDDLFAVGNWKDLIDFSIEIHNKFSKFTCLMISSIFLQGLEYSGPIIP